MSVLLDTTILIDYFRNLSPAVAFIEQLLDPPSLSVINVAELYAGVREGQERQRLDAALGALTILPVTAEIAREAGLMRRRWGPSHGVGPADALIAATAHAHGLDLVTRNRKHFPMLERVTTPY